MQQMKAFFEEEAVKRSPYFPHKSTKSTPDHEDADGQISPFSFLSEDDILATPSSFVTDNLDSSSDDLLLDTPGEDNMKNCETEVFPSVGERILLFQNSKHPIHQMHQVHQVHQVPSKYSRMSTSPTVSPVLGTWSDAHKQQNEKEVFPSISAKISLFQAQGEQLNIPPTHLRRSSAPNFQGISRPSSPTSYLYGVNRPSSPSHTPYRSGSPTRRYESPQQRRSPDLPNTPKSVPGSPRGRSPGMFTNKYGNSTAPPSPLMSPAGNQWGVTRTVELRREPGKELGIGVVMGCVDSNDEDATPLSGIFIKHVVPDSIAGKLGTINRGDRIVAVNGVDLANKSYKEAINTIQNAGNVMKLTVQSLVPWVPSNNNNNNNASSPNTDSNRNNKTMDTNKNKLDINKNKNTSDNTTKNTTNKQAAQTAPQIADGAQSPRTVATNIHKEKLKQRTMSEDEEEDESQYQGKVFTAKGVEIDRKSAGFLKVTGDEEEEDVYGYTQKKIKKKYNDLKGTPILVEIERGAGNLGISLAGNRNRNKMSSFICGLHPNRNAAKTGKIKVGDELLEVNGTVLFGRCHLNVSSIIRSLITPTCKFVLLRQDGPSEDMAVKPITHFPVDAENEEMEELISSYPGVRTVVATKEKGGLGIMVVEGSHGDLGRGVFIADLTKDGAADKAGLMAGDMILAIGRTKLLGADYETASSVLKNEEGAITFIVLNSQKIAEDAAASGKTPAKPPPAVVLDHVGTEIVAEIKRQDKAGLGLTVVGGTDTPVGGVLIYEVYKNGAVAQNGKLQPGDQILEIKGMDMRTATYQDVVNVLRTPGNTVTIRVYRDKATPQENMPLTESTVEVFKKPGKGLGLNIVGINNSKGVYIAEILKGGAAEEGKNLYVGDQILEVNGKNVREASQEAAAAVLKTASGKVSIKIGRIICEKKPPPKRAMH